MNKKRRNIKIFIRVLIWINYLLAGYFLYSESFIFSRVIGTFAKLVYPLSIFWLQIRIRNKEPWLPLTDLMSTSQLWFRLIPIMMSLFTFVIVLLNMLFKLIFIFIYK